MAEKQDLDFQIAMENDIHFVEDFNQITPMKQETVGNENIVKFYENFQLSDDEQEDYNENSQVSEQGIEDVIEKVKEEVVDISSDENDIFDSICDGVKESSCSSSDGTKYSRVCNKRKNTEDESEPLDYECEVCQKKFKKCWILVNHR